MNVILWFIWRRRQFKKWIIRGEGRFLWVDLRGFRQNNTQVEIRELMFFHNIDLAGCRKHPVIYNDMCRIVRGVK